MHADIVFDVLVHSCRLECLLLGFTDYPDIKRTLVGMSERTGMTVSQIADEVFYTGLSSAGTGCSRIDPTGTLGHSLLNKVASRVFI